LEENPDDRQLAARAILHKGLCYEKLGSEQARLSYYDVLSKYSEQAEETAIARERISSLDAYVAELNTKAEQHMKRGNELFKSWEYEDAIKEYEDAITLRPNTLLAMNAQYSIGHSLYKAGNYEDAMTTLTNLMEENPESNIAPVTELMLYQVQYAMENNENQEEVKIDSDGNTFVDPETGITYNKIKTFAGKNDQIGILDGGSNMSPDCRFMVLENKVVPLDGGDPFKLVDMDALRAIYAPDMRNAAFLADSAIWTVPVSPETGRSTGQPQKLLEGGYRFQSPVTWSPDGTQIAFTRIEKNIEFDIWAANITDGGLSRITNSTEIERGPCWSPDGNSIAYKKGSEIWLASISGSENSMLLKNGGNLRRWSPDNKWLFHSNWENNHFYSMDYHKNYEINFPIQVGKFVSFSPEGKNMLFYRSSYDTKWPLKIVSASGGASYKPAGNETAFGSIWLGDSKHIIVQGDNEERNVRFKIISLTGGDPLNINIEAGLERDYIPFDLLPDLKQVAFSVKREDGLKDLYIAPFSVQEARTTGPARLIFEGWSGGAYNVATSWSLDSKKLALIHEGDIWIIPLEGGNPVQITKTPDDKRWIHWSPDGKWISYKIYNQAAQAASLHVIQPDEGISRIVHQNNQWETTWNSDSKSITIFTDNELQVISLDGKILEHILNLKDQGIETYDSPCLSPDGNHFAFVGYESGEESLIIMYSYDSKKITRLAYENLNDYKYGLSWSPDGKWLSYLTYEGIKVRPEGSLWEADFEETIEKISE
jgi:Tol biopolymer transport system component